MDTRLPWPFKIKHGKSQNNTRNSWKLEKHNNQNRDISGRPKKFRLGQWRRFLQFSGHSDAIFMNIQTWLLDFLSCAWPTKETNIVNHMKFTYIFLKISTISKLLCLKDEIGKYLIRSFVQYYFSCTRKPNNNLKLFSNVFWDYLISITVDYNYRANLLIKHSLQSYQKYPQSV